MTLLTVFNRDANFCSSSSYVESSPACDHPSTQLGTVLGSTALTTDSAGASVAELRYRPFGVFRYNTTGQVTSYRFTGQRWDSGTGLYWYRSRWYDPEIGRFIQPDTIVPEPGNPQRLNRYTCVLNNRCRAIPIPAGR